MATFTWTSATSGDWNTAGNWTPATVPDSSSASVLINNAGSYTITIAAGATNVVSDISIAATGPTLEVDGTLDFTGGTGNVIEPQGTAATMLVNGGAVINGGTIDPLVQVTNAASFTGTNVLFFANALQALSGGTAVVNPSGGVEGLSGTTLAAGVFSALGGTIDFGGGANTVDIATLAGTTSGYANLIMIGNGSAIDEWNGAAYVPLEQSVATITAGGTLQSLNRDYTSTNNIVLDNGAMIFSNDTVNTGTVTINADGRYLGNNTTVTNNLINNGTVQAGSGVLVLQGSLGGTGTIGFFPDEPVPRAQLGTVEVTGATANNVALLDGRGLQLDDPAGFTGTIDAPVGANILLQGITADSAVLSGGTLSVMNGTVVVDTLSMTGDYTGDTFNVTSTAGGSAISVAQVVCYARGTRIRTPDGDVPVEQLALGQSVLTASGKTAPVVWVGRRRIDCHRHPAPERVLPVRIRAGAFGPRLPQRDLRLSPQHAVYDEGVLIPVRYLVNGTTVVQEQVAEVEYFHVELPRHDLLLAEGLAAESYLENNDRNSFENGGGAMVLHPDFSRWSWDGRACAELKVIGPEVDAVRAKLERRARRARKKAA